MKIPKAHRPYFYVKGRVEGETQCLCGSQASNWWEGPHCPPIDCVKKLHADLEHLHEDVKKLREQIASRQTDTETKNNSAIDFSCPKCGEGVVCFQGSHQTIRPYTER